MTAVLECLAFISYSRPATPEDNPVNESFFSRFKAEWDKQVVETKGSVSISKGWIRGNKKES